MNSVKERGGVFNVSPIFAKLIPSSSLSCTELALTYPTPPGQVVKLEIEHRQIYLSYHAGQGVE